MLLDREDQRRGEIRRARGASAGFRRAHGLCLCALALAVSGFPPLAQAVANDDGFAIVDGAGVTWRGEPVEVDLFAGSEPVRPGSSGSYAFTMENRNSFAVDCSLGVSCTATTGEGGAATRGEAPSILFRLVDAGGACLSGEDGSWCEAGGIFSGKLDARTLVDGLVLEWLWRYDDSAAADAVDSAAASGDVPVLSLVLTARAEADETDTPDEPEVVGPDGRPYPVDPDTGAVLDPETGKPLPVDPDTGAPLGPDGQPLPVGPDGNYHPDQDDPLFGLDENGNQVVPKPVDPDNPVDPDPDNPDNPDPDDPGEPSGPDDPNSPSGPDGSGGPPSFGGSDAPGLDGDRRNRAYEGARALGAKTGDGLRWPCLAAGALLLASGVVLVAGSAKRNRAEGRADGGLR